MVIIGAGMCGGNAAATLLDEGYQGRVLLVGDEAGVPFGRPPLSKTYLRAEEDLSGWLVRPPDWYAENGVERLTALIEAFRTESASLLAGRGVLTPEEWNHYIAAIYQIQDALEEARNALKMAARR